MIKMSPELAELCGIHAGDGYMRFRERNKGEVEISGSIEEKSYYDLHVIPLINKEFKMNLTGRFFSKGTYGFVTYNKLIRKTFYDLGFPSGKKSEKVKIPESILKSKDKKLYAKFLRGLLDTDGHIGFRKKRGNYCKFKLTHNYYPVVQLSTVSRRLANQTLILLKKLEIPAFRYITPANKNSKYNEKERYTVIINGVERLEKWMKLIGSKNPVKLTRYLVWKKFGFCPTHTTLKQREGILNSKIDIYSVRTGL